MSPQCHCPSLGHFCCLNSKAFLRQNSWQLDKMFPERSPSHWCFWRGPLKRFLLSVIHKSCALLKTLFYCVFSKTAFAEIYVLVIGSLVGLFVSFFENEVGMIYMCVYVIFSFLRELVVSYLFCFVFFVPLKKSRTPKTDTPKKTKPKCRNAPRYVFSVRAVVFTNSVPICFFFWGGGGWASKMQNSAESTIRIVGSAKNQHSPK